MIELLQLSSPTFISITGLVGLLVGSFLNVVIYRLPMMMERDWQSQCDELLGKTETNNETFNLSQPGSRCPNCGHEISALENIPILSYLLLGGKCKQCKTPIPKRYPVIEVLTGLLSGVIAYTFGFEWTCLGALLLTWALIALTFIDADHQLLPDSITLPLLWLGVFFNLFDHYTELQNSVIGAIAGYLSLWLVFHAFRLATGKEGMGYGDFKLLAALGAWLGWAYLPLIIILSSFVGAIVGITLIVLRRHQKEVPIPFGPYLAAAGWITLVWGETINSTYLKFAGLG